MNSNFTWIRGEQYQGTLSIGQRVHSILYGGRGGVIRAVYGEQRPGTVRRMAGIMVTGGGADFDVLFDNGTESRRIPEAVVRGVQWYISDSVADSVEIAALVEKMERETLRKEQEKQDAAEAFRKEVEALPGRYPYLKPVSQNKSSYAIGAANLRIELKRAFPGIRFSVKSQSYSGGCSISVHWVDGPTYEEVTAIADRYQEGRFDGMTDSYTYHKDSFTTVFGGAKYVSCSRHYSVEFLTSIAQQVCSDFGWEVPSIAGTDSAYVSTSSYEVQRTIEQRARETSTVENKEGR